MIRKSCDEHEQKQNGRPELKLRGKAPICAILSWKGDMDVGMVLCKLCIARRPSGELKAERQSPMSIFLCFHTASRLFVAQTKQSLRGMNRSVTKAKQMASDQQIYLLIQFYGVLTIFSFIQRREALWLEKARSID